MRDTLSQLGLPAPRHVGRLVGVGEVLLGAAALMASPGAVASLVAVAVAVVYAVFAVVVIAAVRAGLEDCGCVGARSRTPDVGHVVFDLAACGVAVAAAVTTPVDLVGGLSELSVPPGGVDRYGRGARRRSVGRVPRSLTRGTGTTVTTWLCWSPIP
ncbi:MAG: hypothetical protein M5U19_03180 [Microthrixaceae bacterium]|nr:hypothetical protein [Microthrixaceae bacterium]